MVSSVDYPAADVEKALLARLFPTLPDSITSKMVDFANEVRGLFMGTSDTSINTMEATLSTRTLIRWADLTLKFQPLTHQESSRFPTPWIVPLPSERLHPHEPCFMNSFREYSLWRTSVWGSRTIRLLPS